LSKTDNNKQCFTNFTEWERNCSVWSKHSLSKGRWLWNSLE
jgi:hypothetical protein